MIIYRAINKINGKLYIGQTIHSLKHRKREHLAAAERDSVYFHKAIRKYGKNNFAWEIIHVCSNLFELNNMEIFYVGYYNSFGRCGYNLNDGGSSACPSEITKKKMSESSKGSKNSMWGKKKENNPCWGKRGEGTPMWGKHHSIETKKKMSESQKGDKGYMKGKHHSEETKQKISDSHKGEKNYWFGKSLSENHKKNMSKAQSGERSHMWGKQLSDKTKKKMSKANVGRRHSVEAKKKMSEAHLGIRPVNARPVIISGIFFKSLTSAGKFVGVSRDSIANRIKHKVKWMDYKYA